MRKQSRHFYLTDLPGERASRAVAGNFIVLHFLRSSNQGQVRCNRFLILAFLNGFRALLAFLKRYL